jgi:hypothetical protein
MPATADQSRCPRASSTVSPLPGSQLFCPLPDAGEMAQSCQAFALRLSWTVPRTHPSRGLKLWLVVVQFDSRVVFVGYWQDTCPRAKMLASLKDDGRREREIRKFLDEAEQCEREADRAATMEEAVAFQQLADRWRQLAALYRGYDEEQLP